MYLDCTWTKAVMTTNKVDACENYVKSPLLLHTKIINSKYKFWERFCL